MRKQHVLEKKRENDLIFPSVIFRILPWMASSHIISDNLGMQNSKTQKLSLANSSRQELKNFKRKYSLDNKNHMSNYDKVLILLCTHLYTSSVCMAYSKIKIQMCFPGRVTVSTSLSLQLILILLLPVRSQIPFF